jgi:hypothetical protein
MRFYFGFRSLLHFILPVLTPFHQDANRQAIREILYVCLTPFNGRFCANFVQIGKRKSEE